MESSRPAERAVVDLHEIMSMPAIGQPRLSVIIPTCNRWDLLARCLERLGPGAQSLPPTEYEVIVSDDGEAPDASMRAEREFPWVRWVKGPRLGPAANRNHGARHAGGEWLVFIDDDCVPGEPLLEAYADAIGPGVRALEGAIDPIGNFDVDLAECPVNLEGGLFWSANVAVERSLFEEIGGFDPEYVLPAHEDQDLYLRLRRVTDVSFVPRARVGHPVRVVPLAAAIARVPARCAAWAHHVRKNQRALGYSSRTTAVVAGYVTQITALMSSLRRRQFRAALVALVMVLVGMPLIIIHLVRGARGSGRHA